MKNEDVIFDVIVSERESPIVFDLDSILTQCRRKWPSIYLAVEIKNRALTLLDEKREELAFEGGRK